ncbi:class I SAM-dependent methyltransferase [Candidatus Micrarchaeota archaeon]|nr:class I SAM-dependent methyltransferase [Candidatus Micrarchaeota archaeon]
MKNEWDVLADEWDENRKTPSSTLAFFRQYAHGTVLDAGCGNGRNSLELAKTAERVIAMDASAAMLEKTRPHTQSVANIRILQGRIEQMPLDDAIVDAAFCLAAFHHLRPDAHAAGARELFRVLRPGGHLCLTVWNRLQRRFRDKPKQVDVPWKGKPRYYYFFDESELEGLLKSAGFHVEKRSYEKNGQKAAPKDAQNLCIIARKP